MMDRICDHPSKRGKLGFIMTIHSTTVYNRVTFYNYQVCLFEFLVRVIIRYRKIPLTTCLLVVTFSKTLSESLSMKMTIVYS